MLQLVQALPAPSLHQSANNYFLRNYPKHNRQKLTDLAAPHYLLAQIWGSKFLRFNGDDLQLVQERTGETLFSRNVLFYRSRQRDAVC